MTPDKTPSLLAVVIKSSPQQWFVAGIDMEGAVAPLVRSEPGNLDQYVGLSDDEQISFLRHRLSGAMQRGCDRLWARNAKAARIVLIADNDLPDGADGLLRRLADHFYNWMTRPPVSCYRGQGAPTIEDLDSLECLIGEPELEHLRPLKQALPQLCERMSDSECWEVIQKPA